MLWSVWIYFVIPAITVVLWVFGIRYFWLALFNGGGFLQLLLLIRSAGVVILITFILDMLCYVVCVHVIDFFMKLCEFKNHHSAFLC